MKALQQLQNWIEQNKYQDAGRWEIEVYGLLDKITTLREIESTKISIIDIMIAKLESDTKVKEAVLNELNKYSGGDIMFTILRIELSEIYRQLNELKNK